MRFEHISKDIFYREPFGAVPEGTSVALRFKVFFEEGDDRETFPKLSIRREAVKEVYYFTADPRISISEQDDTAILLFRLSGTLLTCPGVYFYALSENGNIIGEEHQITVYNRNLSVPEWFLDTVIYQIFPDRFYRVRDERARPKKNSFLYSSWYDIPMYIKNSDGDIERWEFFGGNLKGISKKLDYIKSLGAGTLYLNPIFEARSNHRYDTADYMHVDSLLGGDEAFDDLLMDADQNDIRIMLDGVFNHTGRCSRYFTENRDWYTFYDDGTYDCWWGVEDLPAINKNSESFMDFIALSDDSVIKKWSAKGVSGWRLDVADELTDAFLHEIRAAAESVQPESVIMGEVWEDASNKISYGERKMYFTRKELHTHTNYVFRNTVISFLEGSFSGQAAACVFENIRENYPRHNYFAQVNMTGSHDVERLMTAMLRISRNDRGLARSLVKCFSLIQFTSPGVPLIYYGDETCLEGGVDPDNRRTYPWGREDTDMIEWFSSLSEMRKKHRGIVKGDAVYPSCGDENIFAIMRTPCECDDSYYITVCDRFGRGKEFLVKYVNEIISGIENFSEKRYIIIKEAGGYAMLVKLVNISD